MSQFTCVRATGTEARSVQTSINKKLLFYFEHSGPPYFGGHLYFELKTDDRLLK